MQSKAELEKWYTKTDPWGYKTNKDDKQRRKWVEVILDGFQWQDRALDVGAGECFMTWALPAKFIDFIELSDKAAKRAPKHFNRVSEPNGEYDLVTAFGVLYEQYDYKQMRAWIEQAAKGYVLTCHYDKAGVCHDQFDYKQVFYAEFPYREGKQVLRVYDTRS